MAESESDSERNPNSEDGDHQPRLEDSTVGTGSFLAIGCSLIVLVFLIIAVGLFILRQT